MASFPTSVRPVVNEDGTSVLIDVDERLYPEEVVLKAAYWMTDRMYVHLSRSPEGRLVVELRAKNDADAGTIQRYCGEFCNSLIDFAIRVRVSADTEDIQEALLKRAFLGLVPKPLA